MLCMELKEALSHLLRFRKRPDQLTDCRPCGSNVFCFHCRKTVDSVFLQNGRSQFFPKEDFQFILREGRIVTEIRCNVLYCSKTLILFYPKDGGHSGFFTMQSWKSDIQFFRLHFNQMGDMMLTTGCRPGISDHLHSNTTEYESICNMGICFILPCHHTGNALHHCICSLCHKIMDPSAEIFSGYSFGYFPVAKGCKLGGYISDTASD